MASIDIRSDIGLESERTPDTASSLSKRLASWRGRLNVEGTIVLLVLAVGWQFASAYLPPILFPSLGKIATALHDVLTSPSALAAIGITYARILAALSVAFAVATAAGVSAGLAKPVERALIPPIEIMQGIPAVCWIIFAILWFRDMETRIAFVVIVSTVPQFFYQARDGLRAIPAELWDMVRSWRPSPPQLVRILIVPALLPALLTGWRSNLGNGTRVTIFAELLGGVSGIGYQLRLSQELFRMDRAIAWTVVLVAFVIATNFVLSWFEKRALKWRHDRGAANG